MESRHQAARKKANATGKREARTVKPLPVAYHNSRGVMYRGLAEQFLESPAAKHYKGKIQLIFTSPPFPLNRKKKYGNLLGQKYIKWLAEFAPLLANLLTPTGSIVVEMGNAWESGKPVMSTLALEALLAFLKSGNLKLAQQFISHNPARLPSPAQWVNVERIRLKDSYTHLWWMAASERPYADNRKVLTPYSRSMLELLEKRKYNSGKRPSEFKIGATSFFTNNKGAIPSNVLSFSNTGSSDVYQRYCRKYELQPHPARMPIGLAEFFIKFLTKPGQYVLDPFAGSNTTGAAADNLKRRWISIEASKDYVQSSRGRFSGEKKKGK